MPEFQYPLAGQVGHITVPDELADYYRAQDGYVELVPEAVAEQQRQQVAAEVAELKGAELDAAVDAAGIDHPSQMSAGEKRDAVAAARLAAGQDTPNQES